MKWFMLRLVNAVIIMGIGIHAVQGATGVEFSQMSFLLNGEAYNQTDWGDASLTYTPLQGATYFNLVINGVWQVQNLRLMSVEGHAEQTINFTYDLGITSGTPVSSTQYGYQITAATIETKPENSLTAAVNSSMVILDNGLDIEPLANTAIAPPPEPIVVVVDPEPEVVAPNFPNQECNKTECVPAAVSNSLLYLKSQGKIDVVSGLCDISTMKVATKWTAPGSFSSGGCNMDWARTKDQYMRANQYGVTTTKVDIEGLSASDLAEKMRWLEAQIKDGQAVELGLEGKGWQMGHEVTLVSLRAAGVPNMWDMVIKHDEAQGSIGGTVTRYCCYNTQIGLLTGLPGGPCKLLEAVVECPEPSLLVLLILTSMGVIWWRWSPLIRRRR